jgi:RNA polymerase sigma factor (sigma-70 family)
MKEPTPGPATGDRWLKWYRAAPGEQDAQAQVFGEIRAFLLAVLHKKSSGKTHGAFDNSDIAQDCWMKLRLLPPGQEFRGTTGLEFIAWLRTLAERMFLDAERARKAQKRGGGQHIGRLPGDSSGDIAIAADASTPSQQLMRREEEEGLESALGRLPADYQRVIRLRRSADKLTWAEIAGQMGSTEDAVKQLFRRAFRRLSEELRGQP